MAQLNPGSPGVGGTPAFGEATLDNCDREPIHLAGAVQPHGVLLRLAGTALQVVQASRNAEPVLGLPLSALLQRPLAEAAPALAEAVARRLQADADALAAPAAPRALRAAWGSRPLEGLLHREPDGDLVLELSDAARPACAGLPDGGDPVGPAVQRLLASPTAAALGDELVAAMRALTGHDRVMLYRFDDDGHGSVVAEARAPHLAPLLGHHYPASDIPAQARALYVLNRVRVLDDVDAVPAPLVPPRHPGHGRVLDMSWCHLRAMSPMHLQYLRQMGVVASLSVSLVRNGRLWGLVAMHHHAPRGVRLALRAVLELLAEVAATRLTAIENHAHAQVPLLVRRLEQRLIDATSTEGDWRQALLRHPGALLEPLEATGAVLAHEGEVLTAGEVPGPAELQRLLRWLQAQPRDDDDAHGDGCIACASLGRADPTLAPLTPLASGVLAVRLSAGQPDWLVWLRREQLRTVTWAGNPAEPKAGGRDAPLGPRHSFEAWSERVRGSAVPWTPAQRLTARAVATALAEMIVRVHAVRLLIAEAQRAQIRATVHAATGPVLVCDAQGRLLQANQAFERLLGAAAPAAGAPVATLFDGAADVQRLLQAIGGDTWRGEWALRAATSDAVPVAVRIEGVPGRDGRSLGLVIALTDLRGARKGEAARRALAQALSGMDTAGGDHRVVEAIVTNTTLAANDLPDADAEPTLVPQLQALEASARRATELLAQWRQLED